MTIIGIIGCVILFAGLFTLKSRYSTTGYVFIAVGGVMLTLAIVLGLTVYNGLFNRFPSL